MMELESRETTLTVLITWYAAIFPPGKIRFELKYGNLILHCVRQIKGEIGDLMDNSMKFVIQINSKGTRLQWSRIVCIGSRVVSELHILDWKPHDSNHKEMW